MTNPLVDPLVGRTVAHYEILARLGGGGMGVVYRARDTRLGRILALKFLPPQWSHDEGAKQRFVREAQAASATDHPNICTIHDIETAGDGQLFIVMAYYEGQTLKQRLEQGPMPADEALDIATQLADGLAKAHGQGVVHRDIKPGNLILTEDGVRIVDFGLATFADALQLTVAGSTLGTAAYMSPEQVRGEDVDARTDVWAVGVVLYQMLAGHVPFRGAYAEAIAYAIRHDAPPPLRAERPEIPEEVEQLVFRALHKDAAVRFASGRELARALRQLRGQTLPVDLRTEAVIAPPLMAQAAARHRRRAWKLLFTAAVVALLAGIPGAWWWLRPVDRTPIVVVPVANQTGFIDIDPYRSALTQAIVRELADSPDVRVLSWSRTLQTLRGFISRGTDISSRDVVQALTGAGGAQIVILPTLLYEDQQWRVRVEIRDGPTAVAIERYESEPVASALKKDTAYALMASAANLVREHFDHGWLRGSRSATPRGAWLRNLDAAKSFEEGFNWYDEQEYGAAHRAFGEAATLDPRSALAQAWSSRAARLMKRDTDEAAAAEAAAKLVTDDTPPVDRLFVEAVVAEARRDFVTAEARHRGLVEAFPDEVTWAAELAAFHDRRAAARDEWSVAVAAYHDALKIDPSIIRPHLELCRLYNRLQEPQNARAQGGEALSRYQTAAWRGGEALARFCLVDAMRTGTPEERTQAQAHAETALKILEELRFTYNLPRARYYLGLAAAEQGRLGEAVSLWEQTASEAAEAGNVVLQPLVLMNLGAAHLRLNNGALAADYYSRSSTAYERLGDQRRAAQQQFNSAALRVNYGVGASEAVGDLENALAVVRKQGDPDFEVACLEVIGSHYRHVGRHADAERELNRALALARQHNLAQKIASVTFAIARLRFDRADYGGARALLLELVEVRAGRVAAQSWILLGRVHARLGDVASARANLATAAGHLEARDDSLRPRLYLARGELAYESGRLDEARSLFRMAASSWTGAFIEEEAVEARAYSGLLDALQGHTARGRNAVQASVDQAQTMERVALETTCRILLARIHLAEQQPQAALRALADVLPDKAGLLSVELRAYVHYWRGRALGAQGDAAASELSLARTLFDELRASVPASYRDAFSARPDVRVLVR